MNCLVCSGPLTEGGTSQGKNKEYRLLYCGNTKCEVFVIKVTIERIDLKKKTMIRGAMLYGNGNSHKRNPGT